MGQGPGQRQAFNPLGVCHLHLPLHSGCGWGQLLPGAGSTRQTLALGNEKSTDYDGQLNSPSSALHGLSPLPIKALCTGRELSVGPFSLERGWLWDLPGSPVRAGVRGSAIVFAAVLPLDFEQARGWWSRFPPLRRLRQSREEDPRGK